MINKVRCWFGKHTFTLYADKFFSCDPWDINECGYGYRAKCYVCGLVKEKWLYDSRDDVITHPDNKYKEARLHFRALPNLEETDEL